MHKAHNVAERAYAAPCTCAWLRTCPMDQDTGLEERSDGTRRAIDGSLISTRAKVDMDDSSAIQTVDPCGAF